MIVRPRRSVTRFFIPLIDVLILLFCIFLLMPFVSQPEDEERLRPTEGDGQAPLTDREALDEIDRLRDRMAELERDLEAMRRRRPELSESISVKVLEIDPANGDLYYFDPDRRVIRDQADAQRLIDDHRRQSGIRDPFFLILYPRRISGFPTLRQVETYRRWFAAVPHGFDNPLSGS